MRNVIFVVLLGISVFVFWGCQEAVGPETESNTSMPMVESVIDKEPPDCDKDACVRSPGYWKNHLDEWPEDGNTWYDDWFTYLSLTKEGMQDYMVLNGMNKNKWFTMFKAVVAAKLDLDILGSSHCYSEKFNKCICKVANEGFAWLHAHNHQTELVKANSKCWQKEGEDIYLELDAYYNGYLCDEAKPCD